MKIDSIQVFGERNSGTNYIRKLVETNYKDIKSLGIYGNMGYGWKHGDLGKPWHYYNTPPNGLMSIPIRDYKTDAANTLFIVIYRNPLTWIQSMHRSPHHAPEMVGVPLKDFISKPWRSYYGELGQDFDQDPKVRLAIVRPENLFEDYKNIFEMRKEKIAIFESFAQKVPNVVYVQYEHLLEDHQFVIQEIAKHFNIKLATEHKNIAEDKFGTGTYRKTEYAAVDPKILKEMITKIDWQSESEIGYEYAYTGTSFMAGIRSRLGFRQFPSSDTSDLEPLIKYNRSIRYS